MRCAAPRSNFLSTRNALAICSHLATAMVPQRTQLLLLATVFIPIIVFTADYSASDVAVLAGDTIEVLHKCPGVGVLIHASIPLRVRPTPNYVNC